MRNQILLAQSHHLQGHAIGITPTPLGLILVLDQICSESVIFLYRIENIMHYEENRKKGNQTNVHICKSPYLCVANVTKLL